MLTEYVIPLLVIVVGLTPRLFGEDDSGSRMEIAVCAICQKSTPGAVPFTLKSPMQKEDAKGFYLPQAVLTMQDISEIEGAVREWVVPLRGIHLRFAESAKNKAKGWEAAEYGDRMLILIGGVPRARVRKGDLWTVINDAEAKLFIAMPAQSEEERRKLDELVRQLQGEAGKPNKKNSDPKREDR
jgi:hypothetical protein